MIIPLKPLQVSMAFHFFYNPKDLVNSEMLVYKIKGTINIEILKQACFLSTHHNVLKSLFIWENTELPVQMIAEKNNIKLEVIYSSDLLQKIEDIWTSFCDISYNPFRIIYLYNEKEQYFIIRTHHILLDGWSQVIWINDLMRLYNQIYLKEKIKIFKQDYAKYVCSYFEREKENYHYWIESLSGYKGMPILSSSNEKHCQEIYSSEKFAQKLFIASIKYKVTVSQFLYALWALYLAKINHNYDVVFNIVCSGRENNPYQHKGTIGMLMNVIPARVIIDYQVDIQHYVKLIQLQILDMLERQELNILKIMNTLPSDVEIIPDTCLDIQNYPISGLLINRNKDFEMELVEHRFISKNPLILAIRLHSKTIEMEFCYDIMLYNSKKIQEIIKTLEWLAETIIISDRLPVYRLLI